jgi:hypothetical protein
MSENGLYMARTKPHVQAFIDQEKQGFIAEVEAMKAPIRAQAIEIGKDLMRNAKSEAVKARMVEFFAREPERAPSVVVQNHIHAGTYAYPSLRDVTPHDGASVAHEPEEPSQQGPSGKR